MASRTQIVLFCLFLLFHCKCKAEALSGPRCSPPAFPTYRPGYCTGYCSVFCPTSILLCVPPSFCPAHRPARRPVHRPVYCLAHCSGFFLGQPCRAALASWQPESCSLNLSRLRLNTACLTFSYYLLYLPPKKKRTAATFRTQRSCVLPSHIPPSHLQASSQLSSLPLTLNGLAEFDHIL